ncbi:MAG: hypothetical protein ACRD8O_07835 [Bryobacteraceae bacterium]
MTGSETTAEGVAQLFDEAFEKKERLPRIFRVQVAEVEEDGKTGVALTCKGVRLGEPLVDYTYDEDDGYRYHDALHFAFAALLGWSPVTRALMRRRRRSVPKIFEVEDAGRAIAVEEGIVLLVLDYVRGRGFEGVERIDPGLLQTVKRLTDHLEVRDCSVSQWEHAILRGVALWRELMAHRRGTLRGNLHQRTILFVRTEEIALAVRQSPQ